MLPRRTSTKDFYACGARVHIPSIKVNNGTIARHKYDPRSAAANSTAREGGPENGRLRKRHTVGGAQASLRSHVRELKRSLTFSEGVVSSRSPHAMSYRQARGRLARVFLPVSDTRRRRFPELAGGVGRHNCRGEPRKHPLCHLHHVQTADVHLDEARPQPLPSSHSSSPPPKRCYGNVPSHPSGMLYRDMRIVPASKSVQWEEDTLKNVTSSTAAWLGGRRSGGGREDEGGVEEERDVVERGRVRSEIGDVVEVGSEDVVCAVQDFVTSLGKGARPVFQGSCKRGRGGGDIIVLDNDTIFAKVLQSSYPQPPSEWSGGPREREDETLVRGGRRWTNIPQPAETPERLRWVRGNESDHTPSHLSEVRESTSPPRQSSSTYCSILQEWSSRHSIHVHLEDASEAFVLQNIHSHNDSSKLRGIAACSYLAEQGRRCESGYRACREEGGEGGRGLEEVVGGLERVMKDEATSVHIPAAIALHCLGRESKEAVDVLLSAVRKGGCDPIDEWAGLQCLVEGGVCEECVVEGLQRYLLTSGYLLTSADSSRREQAGQLMVKMSDRMPLVHALLAEQLTSRGWQERLSACHALPTLLCPLSNDVCSRLVVMSWEDWSSAVREAASQVLGKTGHGKLLHDELVRRLGASEEVRRLDALHKLHYLHLMTPQLLAAFLPSLSDQHASIRTQAIAICGRLSIADRSVVQQLIQLLGDPIWSIRAHTLRALGSIGCCDGDVMEQLLWTVRCDKVPAVRAEACHTLCQLWQRKKQEGGEGRMRQEGGEGRMRQEGGEGDGKREGQVSADESRLISTLRDRLVVEDDAMVTKELTSALCKLGASAEREDPLMDSIRTEIQRLGTSQAITQGVLDNDRATITDYIIARPLVHPSTRDYLTPCHRHKFYSDKTASTATSAIKGVGPTVERVWSPDRETIDRRLASIRQKCTTVTAQLPVAELHPSH